MSKMKVGITGQAGFVGYHLWCALRGRSEFFESVEFEDAWYNNKELFSRFVAECDCIVHLAGMNRGDPEEVYRTNIALAERLIQVLRATKKTPLVIFASSTQETLDNPYGTSKRRAGELLESWAREEGGSLMTLVIPNVFGPFGRPFYNSVVATFCHQLTHAEIPQIHVDAQISLIYVGDLVDRTCMHILERPTGTAKVQVPASSVSSVSSILDRLGNYRRMYMDEKVVPDLRERFDLSLFNTFRSYIDESFFPAKLVLRADERGHLVENLKVSSGGQAFFSLTKAGIMRGNHYHLRKFERFSVVAGSAVIRLRRIGTTRVIEYPVSGDEPSYVDMPVMYTHNIQNTGSKELLTLFWSSEFFDPRNPDTFVEKV